MHKKVYLIEGGGAIVHIMNNVDLTAGRIEWVDTGITKAFIFNQSEAKCTTLFMPPYNLKRTVAWPPSTQTTERLSANR